MHPTGGKQAKTISFLSFYFFSRHHAEADNTRVTTSHKNEIKAQMIAKNGFYFIVDTKKGLNDLSLG